MQSHSHAVLNARMDMGMTISDNMSMGTINVTWFPQLYWICIGSTIAAFALVNLLNKALYRQRILAARSGKITPAKPKTLFWCSLATLFAVTRELSNFAGLSLVFGRFGLRAPSLGSVFLVLANAVLLVVLGTYALDYSNYLQYQSIAYRWGFVSLGQLSLIFALAGKNNIIGWLTGTSYERLNWLHRWVARTLLLTVTIHMAYWFADWAPYNFITYQIQNDTTTQRGLISWAILVWIIFSSFAPIRSWSYEIFVIQHLISYIALTTMIFLHVPSGDYGWLWPPVALFLFDRVIRGLYMVYTNLALFHPKKRREGIFDGFWACRAQLTPLGRNATRVTIQNPPISWKAGQHAFLSCHSLIPLQSHPFTISTLPEDGKLEFIIQARRGATRRLFTHAEKQLGLPSIHQEISTCSTMSVAIEGPYGRMRPLQQFDSVCLVAGSTGATFTMPLLRDIVRQWKTMSQTTPASNPSWLETLTGPSGAVTRRIAFIWAVKSTDQLAWFAAELAQVSEDVSRLRKQGLDVTCDIQVYITCDERLTGDYTDAATTTHTRPELTDPDSSDASSLSSSSDEKKDPLKPAAETINVQEIDARIESGAAKSCCAGDGSAESTCCCRAPALADTANAQCTCNAIARQTSGSSSLSGASRKALLHSISPHPAVSVHTGRPSPRALIRGVLEGARGESGVVACGPAALNAECRRAVVALSDERAACKGTGALAVWYHGEGFGYA